MSADGAGQGHAPVMLAEVLRALAPIGEKTILDATFGGGGYTRAVLRAGASRVIALDRDPDAIERGRELATQAPRLTLVHARFGELDRVVEERGLAPVDAVVFDLGVSSFQLDQAERGFSFRHDAPLDMRMDKQGPTAADLIAQSGEVELARLLWNYGDERDARRIARAVVAERQKAPIATTRQLAEIVARAKGPSRELIDPATRTFQALRIAVNEELAELRAGLAAAERVVRPGGRLVAVSFHSGEDSIVKDFVNERGGRIRRAYRHLPPAPESEPRWSWLTDRPLRPDPSETEVNPRARSARLRAAVRLPADAEFPESARDADGTREDER
jgi:16S rRNA (cytosine1402-N4)-methyltransferase